MAKLSHPATVVELDADVLERFGEPRQRYAYHNGQGEPVAIWYRFAQSSELFWRSRGTWVVGTYPTLDSPWWLPYHADKIADASCVIVVPTEAACEWYADFGVVATTMLHAGVFERIGKTDCRMLRHKRVRVVPPRGELGAAWLPYVLRVLERDGVAFDVVRLGQPERETHIHLQALQRDGMSREALAKLLLEAPGTGEGATSVYNVNSDPEPQAEAGKVFPLERLSSTPQAPRDFHHNVMEVQEPPANPAASRRPESDRVSNGKSTPGPGKGAISTFSPGPKKADNISFPQGPSGIDNIKPTPEPNRHYDVISTPELDALAVDDAFGDPLEESDDGLQLRLLDSIRRGAWLPLPLGAMRSVGAASLTLGAMLSLSRGKTFVANERIADAARLPLRTVKRHLSVLEGEGLVIDHGRGRTSAGRTRRTVTRSIAREVVQDRYLILPRWLAGDPELSWAHHAVSAVWFSRFARFAAAARRLCIADADSAEGLEEWESAAQGQAYRWRLTIPLVMAETGIGKTAAQLALAWLETAPFVDLFAYPGCREYLPRFWMSAMCSRDSSGRWETLYTLTDPLEDDA